VQQADLAFVNGRLFAPDHDRVQALTVRDGRIVALGSDRQVRALVAETTRVVDLEGKALLPGFIDAHTHLLTTGLQRTFYLDAHTSSLDDLLQKVEAAAQQRPLGQWIVGRGWDESTWKAARYPSLDDLDRVAPQHPVALIRVCGHILSVNSAALAATPLKDNAATVDRAHGWLREESAWGFLSHVEPDLDERVMALEAGIAHAHARGVTSIHDVVDRKVIQAYGALQRAGTLNLRVRLNLVRETFDAVLKTGFGGEFGDGFLRLGALKLFADGSIGARNAALQTPYLGQPRTRGELVYPQQDLVAWLRKGHENGFQLMVHAIGDGAIERVLDAYEAVGIAPQHRARVEHLELPHDKHLARMERLGVVASMQPNFLQWSGAGKLYEQCLGTERDAIIDPHRRVLEHSVPLALGSDSMPLDPLYGVRRVVNAPHEAQRLSLEQALQAYTAGSAYAGRCEASLGTLELGQAADLVVLSEDPFASPQALERCCVEQTYVAGQQVYP